MMGASPDPDPLLPIAARGVRRGCRWVRWYLYDRWVLKRTMERDGWRKDDDGWRLPDA